MKFELFQQIVDECAQYGPRSFSLHLFGEPLLCSWIMEGIRYIKDRDPRNTILLTTNGTVLNQFSDRLYESKVDRIIWTWRKNNFNARTLEVLRRIGVIRILVEETPESEIEKWRSFPRVEIKHLHNYGGQIDTSKWGVESQNGPRYPCYHLWLAPAIRWNGDITICCNDPRGEERAGVYGQDGFDLGSFWRGDRLGGIRASHLKNEYKGLCGSCNVWKTYPDMFFDFQKK